MGLPAGGERRAGEKRGDSPMKVVVVRSPRALRGILRLLFRIKKEENC